MNTIYLNSILKYKRPVLQRQFAESPVLHLPTSPFPWRREATRHRAESREFALRGARVHCRQWSKDTGPLLLFVHGFAGHTHWWDWIAPAFCERYSTVAMDLSGMGDSEWRPEYPPEAHPLDILEVIDHLQAGPAVVVGHSFGGGALLRACARDIANGAPPRISHAVVVDSFVRLEGHRIPNARSTAGARALYPDLDTALGRFRLNPDQPVQDPGMLDYLARRSLRGAEGGWHWKFDPKIPGPQKTDASALLASIATPVDVVVGEHSVVIDRALAEACVAALPRGRGPHVIRGGNHHLMLDQPRALIATLETLLGGAVTP